MPPQGPFRNTRPVDGPLPRTQRTRRLLALLLRGRWRRAEQLVPGASIFSRVGLRRSAVQLAPRPDPPVGVPSTSAAARTRGFYHSPRTAPGLPYKGSESRSAAMCLASSGFAIFAVSSRASS